MLVSKDDDMFPASLTGQIVVYAAIVSVTRTVCTASAGNAEMANVSVAAGQLDTVGAQLITVFTCVATTVRVV